MDVGLGRPAQTSPQVVSDDHGLGRSSSAWAIDSPIRLPVDPWPAHRDAPPICVGLGAPGAAIGAPIRSKWVAAPDAPGRPRNLAFAPCQNTSAIHCAASTRRSLRGSSCRHPRPAGRSRMLVRRVSRSTCAGRAVSTRLTSTCRGGRRSCAPARLTSAGALSKRRCRDGNRPARRVLVHRIVHR